MQGTNLFVRGKRERCCFVLYIVPLFIEISYLQVTEKSHYLLQFTTNSAVLAFQVSVLDGCVGECVPSWLTNVSVFGIITCTDVQWINVSKLFSLLVQSFWIANLYYASWLTWQCKESCLYMYVMSVKCRGFTGFCGSGFGFSQIC